MVIELYNGGQKVFTADAESVELRDQFVRITYKDNKKKKSLDSNLPYIVRYDSDNK
jgi:hypothetical protein